MISFIKIKNIFYIIFALFYIIIIIIIIIQDIFIIKCIFNFKNNHQLSCVRQYMFVIYITILLFIKWAR
jgi:hypothetical protein